MTVFFDADEEQAIATVWYMQTRRKGQEAQFRNMRRAGWLIAAFAAFMVLLLFLKFSPLALLMAFLYSAMAALFIRQEPIQRKLVAQAVKAGAAQTVLGPQEYTLTPQGIRHKSFYSDGVLPWAGISKLEVTDTQLAFHFSEMQAFLIPKSAFASEAHCQQFLQQAQQYRLQAAQQPTAHPVASATGTGWWTQGSITIESPEQNIQQSNRP